ncbi:(2Fe-2S)-binding protein [Thermosediminibacter litoriperuensis]|uniref:BFD-like [2Fe-2S] binding protein n=1 Tax=Thermosediminibacter litoriperuensis TaxID=291989 RepID=A0A5S5APC5_9FIRM|nr:(2Fe-2S)-binding protein [Thermosediminibacter litoriperuensis]TYP53321.1 BFD-like [2Fe-2S] binding protein [Thermosediminibacter litoriperuensis]
MKSKTVICRCEDVTLEEIEELMEKGYTSMDEIKRITRCGMGQCQGRTCRTLLLAELAKAVKTHPAEIKITTFRPPAKNIKMSVILGGIDNEQNG